ncbi:MAG: hypothetical protein DHS20C15_10730 [Planctomycetota bacterium]|nr:MAG: hypothetical protein DHS20C15_10730 [Planctomycetota bacterium]
MSDAAPILDLQGAEVRYGKRVALSGLDAQIGGGAVGLLGPNGAGKSSLIKALLGLVPLSKGSATVLGNPVGSDPARMRRRIGYMPERDAAFPTLTGYRATWYAGRLAGLPDDVARRRAHEVLLFAGMEEARYREVSTYSTGMRQRVKLAQALVHDPDLLFLDEPTNGLDPKGRAEMLGLIRQLSRERGIHVVLSSHLLRDVEEVCESVVVINGGKLVMHADIEELSAATEMTWRVGLYGEGSSFQALCSERGVNAAPRRDGGFELSLPEGMNPREVFALARASEVVVRSLEPTRRSLEDALMDVLGEVDA